MNQAQINWKKMAMKCLCNVYNYYINSFKPAKKGLCFPTSNSARITAFTVRQKAASRHFVFVGGAAGVKPLITAVSIGIFWHLSWIFWILGWSLGLTTAIGEQPTHELTILDLAISISISLPNRQGNGSCSKRVALLTRSLRSLSNEVWPQSWLKTQCLTVFGMPK